VADAATDPDATNAVPTDDTLPDQRVLLPTEEHLPTHRPPERLSRGSHYLICDKTRVVAAWENNGNGWMLKSGPGLVSVKRNRDKLPTEGDFQIVELKFAVTPEGKRLSGIISHQLVSRWALTMLDQGDDPILEKISGPGRLNRDQKNVIRQAIKEQFMRPVWAEAADVLDYLANADYHSPGVG